MEASNPRNRTIATSVTIVLIFGMSLGNSYAQSLLARFGEFFPDVDPSLFPYFQSVSFLGAIIGALVVGALVPRIVGYKPMAIIASLLFLIPGVLPVWFHDSFAFMCFLKCLVGIGAGSLAPIANGLATAALEGTRRQKILSIGSAFAQIMAICMQMAAGILGDQYFWWAFFAPVFSVVTLVGAFMIVEPEKPDREKDKFKLSEIPGRAWYCAVVEFIACLGVIPLLFNFSYYVIEVSDLITAATSVQAMYSVGMAVGGALYFLLFRVFKRRTVGFSMLICLIGMVGFVTLGKNLPLLMLFNLLVGIGYGSFYPAMMDSVGISVKPSYVAFSTSLLLFFMNMGSFAVAPFIQAVGTATGDPVHAPVYAGIVIYIILTIVLTIKTPYPDDISSLIEKANKRQGSAE